VGGKFTSINGSGRSFDASLNPSTGRDDGYLNLNLTGTYVYPGAGPNYTQAYNQQLSPDGRHVLVEGVFTSVQGQSRQQIFMLNLGANHASLSAWNSSEFGQHCSDGHPFYIKGAAWSPDQATVYIATTGEHPNNWGGSFPLTGLCDVAAAFPAAQADRPRRDLFPPQLLARPCTSPINALRWTLDEPHITWPSIAPSLRVRWHASRRVRKFVLNSAGAAAPLWADGSTVRTGRRGALRGYLWYLAQGYPRCERRV
jgi:hypothetical protein